MKFVEVMVMEIKTPTLIINKEQVLKNVRKIQAKVEKAGIIFRPHFKTHQSADVGGWLKDLGIQKITVSSVHMAECFAEVGWDDITIAFPVNILEIERINNLAKTIKLNLLIESLETINFLDEKLKYKVDVWINIDTGYHRDGIGWEDSDKFVKLADLVKRSDKVKLKGILTHAGHSYKARTKAEILAVHRDTVNKMSKVQEKLNEEGYSDILISVGDTPTASVADDFSLIDEIRPGNFVFYDLTQAQIGSCLENEIAVRLACPVTAKYEDRKELLINGGAVHLSKDFITDKHGRTIFGYVSQSFDENPNKIEDVYVSSLSQEHGIIKTENLDFFHKTEIGDVVYIIPVHSCLTTNLAKKLITTDGEEIHAGCK